VPTFAVSPEKIRALEERMRELGVTEADLEETFIRSSGRGGQHVNKSSTAVQIRHRESGVVVTCMRERSQSVNRFLARRELMERIARLKGLPSRIDGEIARVRKNKDRRRRRRTAREGEES